MVQFIFLLMGYIMSGVNKVIIVGNLGHDPESKFLDNGTAVTKISVATSKSWKDKDSGELKEKSEWHRVVMYKRLAEIASEYLKKGSKVYIEGELQTSKWVDEKTGQKCNMTQIIASEMQMLSSKDVSHGTNEDEPRWSNSKIQPGNVSPDLADDDIPF